MADISSGTPEAIALELLERIATVEGKVMTSPTASTNFNPGYSGADRKWILDTYNECLRACKQVRPGT